MHWGSGRHTELNLASDTLSALLPEVSSSLLTYQRKLSVQGSHHLMVTCSPYGWETRDVS